MARLLINDSENYSVGKADGTMEVFEKLTLSEANILLESIAQSDPHGVYNGEYYIDGPAAEVKAVFEAVSEKKWDFASLSERLTAAYEGEL